LRIYLIIEQMLHGIAEETGDKELARLVGPAQTACERYFSGVHKGGSASVASQGGRIGSKKTAAAEFYGKTNNTGQVMMSQADVSSHKGGIKTGRQQIANKRGNRKGTGTIQKRAVALNPARRKRLRQHEIAKVWTPEVCIEVIDKRFGNLGGLTVAQLMTIKDCTISNDVVTVLCGQQVLQVSNTAHHLAVCHAAQ
jgi:hypothetical protein